jgi:UDP-N-acetylglucosamine kinase
MTSTVSSGYEPYAARSYPNCEGSVAPEVDRTRYVLSEEENERIFREAIVPQTLTGTSQNQPVAVFVAGQTGAGKTAVTSLVDHALAQAGQAVNINLDTYKPYHPRYDELSVADDTTVGAYTSIDGHKWMEKAEAYAIENRVNVLMESAMRDPRDFEEPASRFRDAGYRVEVAILSVHESHSRLGALTRYLEQVQDFGQGRQIDPQIHDACYSGVVRSANSIDADRLADNVFVLTRSGHAVYSNHLGDDGQWTSRPGTAQAVTTERDRPRTVEETHQFARSLHHAQSLMASLPPIHQEAAADEMSTIKDLARPILQPGISPQAREALQQIQQIAARTDELRAQPRLTVSPQADPQPQPGGGRTDQAPAADQIDWRSRPYGDVPTTRLPGEVAAAEREAARQREVAERRAGQAGQLRAVVQAGQGPAMRELEQHRAQLSARVAAGTQAAEARAAAEAGYTTSRQAWQQIQDLDAEQQHNPLALRGKGTSQAEITAQQERLRETARAATAEANQHDRRAQELDHAAGGPDGAAAATTELDSLTARWEQHAVEAQQHDIAAVRSHEARAAAALDQAVTAEQQAGDLRTEAQLRDRADPDAVRSEEAERQAQAEHDAEVDREGPSLGR